MEKLCILGKSSYAISIIIDILQLTRSEMPLISIISNIPDKENSSLEYPFLSPGIMVEEYKYSEWQSDGKEKLVLGSIGKGRKEIYNFFKEHNNIQKECFVSVIHPSAVIASTALLGKGVHISPNTTVCPHAEVGDFTVINRNCSIGHHTNLKDFVTVNPGVTIAGVCEIGKNTMIGAGATIIDQITIGKNVTIGAGSVVTKDIPDNVVAYGVPAKVIREK